MKIETTQEPQRTNFDRAIETGMPSFGPRSPRTENSVRVHSQVGFQQPCLFSEVQVQLFVPREFNLGPFSSKELRSLLSSNLSVHVPSQGLGGLDGRRYASLSLQQILSKYASLPQEAHEHVDYLVSDCLQEVGGAWLDWIRMESQAITKEIFYSSNLLALDSRRIGHFHEIAERLGKVRQGCSEITTIPGYETAKGRGVIQPLEYALAEALSKACDQISKSLSLALELAHRQEDQVYQRTLIGLMQFAQKLPLIFPKSVGVVPEFHSKRVIDWVMTGESASWSTASQGRREWQVVGRFAGRETWTVGDLNDDSGFRVLQWRFDRRFHWPSGNRESGRDLHEEFRLHLDLIRDRLSLSWARPVCELHFKIESKSVNRRKPPRLLERLTGQIQGAEKHSSQSYRLLLTQESARLLQTPAQI